MINSDSASLVLRHPTIFQFDNPLLFFLLLLLIEVSEREVGGCALFGPLYLGRGRAG